VAAVLRGDGEKGENIYNNAINFAGIPKQLPQPITIQVKGEAVISQSNFIKLLGLSNEAYKNRRNCIPGICRRFDGQYSSLLSFYAYTLEDYSNADKKSQLIKLYNLGFKIPFAKLTMTEDEYNAFGDIRDTAEDFQMDRLVLKTNDGLHEIALKFEPKGEISTVTEYTWEVGTTGKLVPKIHFEQVNVGGSNLTQAAVGSYNGYILTGDYVAFGSEALQWESWKEEDIQYIVHLDLPLLDILNLLIF
jgi:DNA ligase (NAD+)